MLAAVVTPLRSLRGYIARGLADDHVNFVRFQDECVPPDEETELRNVANGKPVLYGGAKPAEENGGANGELPFELDSDVDQDPITEWQAGWNVTNAIQGMFIVTFPHAVLGGGYWALLAMVLVAYVCCYTGKILIECLYEESKFGPGRERMRNSYVQVAEAVWGPTLGAQLVNAAQIVELLMTCILYVVLCGDLLIGSFPRTPLNITSWIAVSSALLLPCALLRSLRHVSFFSFWCTVAHLVINAVIVVYCFSRAAEWHWGQVQVRIDIWTFPISLGIIIFSYTSQIFLPTLEGNMIRRQKFHCMMHWTHAAAAAFKVAFSYVCFLTWGLATKEVVTNNLPDTTMRIVVNFCLIAKALLSYPLPYFAAFKLLEDTFFRGKASAACYDSSRYPRAWYYFWRITLVAFTGIVAAFAPHFAVLMGLIGSFTGNMLSLVWPCYFHLKLKGYTMKWQQKWVDICIIVMGFICAILGIYYSTHALIEAFRGHENRPFQGDYHNNTIAN